MIYSSPPGVWEVCLIYGGGFEQTGLHIMQDYRAMYKRKLRMSEETL
jgi:squalene cyclase